jgi:hypothetical protein
MRLERWTGLAALAGVLLFAAANALWAFEQPAPDASGAEVVRFYEEASGRIAVAAPLSLLAIALFVAFACLLRSLLLDRGAPRWTADLALAGTLLGAAPGLGAETVNMAAALRAGDEQLTPDLALALFDVSYVLGSYAAGPGFGLFAVAVAATSLLPRPLAIAGLVTGVLLATSIVSLVIGEYTVAPAFILAAILGVRLLRPPTLGA